MLFLSEIWITNKKTYNLDIQGFCSEHLFGNKSKGVKKEDIVAVYPSIIKTV